MASGYALPTGSELRLNDLPSTNGDLYDDGYPYAKDEETSSISSYQSLNGRAHSQESQHLHTHKDSVNKILADLNGTGATFRESLPKLNKSRVRARGESDLGRPANTKSAAYRPSLSRIPSEAPIKRDLPRELLTALLVCLPFLAASFSVGTNTGAIVIPHGSPSSTLNELKDLQESVLTQEASKNLHAWALYRGTAEALAISSGILLTSGIVAVLHPVTEKASTTLVNAESSPKPPASKRQDQHTQILLLEGVTIYNVLMLCLSVLLPVLAATKLEGWRASLLIICLYTTGIIKLKDSMTTRRLLPQATIAVLFGFCITDWLCLTSSTLPTDTLLGYALLLATTAFTRSPFPSTDIRGAFQEGSRIVTPISPSVNPWQKSVHVGAPRWRNHAALTQAEAKIFLIAGLILSALTILSATRSPIRPDGAYFQFVFYGLVAVISGVLATRYARTKLLQSDQKTGAMFVIGVLSIIGFAHADFAWYKACLNLAMTGLLLLAMILDTRPEHSAETGHAAVHRAHAETKQRRAPIGSRHSGFTNSLIQLSTPGSLVHSILSEKDSRRIAYFTCLNFAFMLVQGAYGYLSGSLGLLSDTVHMFFDCLGLIVGLGAAVASKWPPSRDRPFGWGNLNTLAGFGNGVFLMLVSVEFVWEAIEGILEGRELRRVKELFVVSTLGLLVNLVGLFAFGHAHAGHDHSHGHSHGHSHHDHHHEHEHGSAHHDHKHGSRHDLTSHAHHDHAHGHNENMHGIFLHVAADAGGSLAVIISTALTLYQPWYLWDPLATIIIAILIFAAAVPLVVASGQKLLLIIPEDVEYGIKNFLQEVGEVRGVLAYSAPRFWMVEETDTTSHGCKHDQHDAHKQKSANDTHEHTHEHDHNHEQHSVGSHVHDDIHHNHQHGDHGPTPRLTGCLHVTAVPFADLDDVRERIEELASSKGMRLIIHVEYNSEVQCWCGGEQHS